MSSISSINELLNDKLFQVIGSTPASIAESLKKVNLKDNTTAGAQMFAVCIFASAVNKSTLETFVADSRFAAVRPLINAALSISGRSNMTALTLLGHCFLTTSSASSVTFATEFRKKMGQDSLWAGELESGSLSDMQKKILKEKKRITNQDEAKALGSGFLKHCGLVREQLIGLEITYFGTGISSSNLANQQSSGSSQISSGTVRSGINRETDYRSVAPPAIPAATTPASGSSTRVNESERSVQPPRVPRRNTNIPLPAATTVSPSEDIIASIPQDVLDYRRNIMNHSDSDLHASINRNGFDRFVSNTRQLIRDDPDGTRIQNAQSAVGNT